MGEVTFWPNFYRFAVTRPRFQRADLSTGARTHLGQSFASRLHLADRVKTVIEGPPTGQERAKKPETRRKSPESGTSEHSLQARGRRFDPGWLHSVRRSPTVTYACRAFLLSGTEIQTVPGTVTERGEKKGQVVSFSSFVSRLPSASRWCSIWYSTTSDRWRTSPRWL